MIVTFATGEVFDGPWTDDPEISEEGLAYRRLASGWIKTTESGESRVSSAALQPHPDSNAISVTLEEVALTFGLDPVDTALEGYEEYGLATFTVAQAREIGFMIRAVATETNPAHALLFASNSETGEVPHRNRCRTLGKRLSKLGLVVRHDAFAP